LFFFEQEVARYPCADGEQGRGSVIAKGNDCFSRTAHGKVIYRIGYDIGQPVAFGVSRAA